MLSIGKLFAAAAIVMLLVGFIRWPVERVGVYTITIKNRAYGFSSDYWAFSVGAIFAVIAVAYYWISFVLSLRLGMLASNLHFWMSASAAVVVLVLLPAWETFSSRSIVSDDRAALGVLAVTAVSILLFLIAQIIFIVNCIWSALYSRKA
ncbi:MAG: hypothetical protein DMG32_02435 [Acidobacteria bacterium]|nr:MAG: hypothetical protein DMG32_02435 [Acidobacteriota bacterium]